MPDLELIITILQATEEQISRLVEAAKLAGYPVGRHPRSRQIYLDGVHDLLTEGADWSAQYWSMDLSKLEPLAEAIQLIYELSPAGIAVKAIWAGDKPSHELELSVSELADFVRKSCLGTRTEYIVRK